MSEQVTTHDPVCGMIVDTARAKATVVDAGKTYYFCSAECADRFRAAPEKYLAAKTPAPGSAVEYTCPMHPEIVRSGPGACPICGMALEPRTVTAEEDNPELRDMTRRFWVSVVLTTPLLAIAMGSMLWPHAFMTS